MGWDFLLQVMECLGFEARFRELIRSILRSARLSIAINGRLEGFFPCSRGVRQGDPLSPLLFSIGEEVLARMMEYRGGGVALVLLRLSLVFLFLKYYFMRMTS